MLPRPYHLRFETLLLVRVPRSTVLCIKSDQRPVLYARALTSRQQQ